jgi:hypothetical protein
VRELAAGDLRDPGHWASSPSYDPRGS